MARIVYTFHLFFRHTKRDGVKPVSHLFDHPLNSLVVEDMQKYMEKESFVTSTNKSNLSTIRKIIGYLFKWEDSLLNFEYSKSPSFNLSRLINFQSDDHLQIRDPRDWIDSISGDDGKENPGRRYDYQFTVLVIFFLI